MPFDYSSLVTPISDIIDEFEMGTVSIMRRVETVNPNDPWDYTVAESETSINAVVTGVSAKKINNTSILEGDIYVIFSPNSVGNPPNVSDRIKIDNVSYSVVKTIIVPPAGTTILYRCQCRRV